MTAINVYNASGVKTGQVEIDPTKLDIAVRRALLKEALIAHLASQRQGTHKNKDRGEVAGGGRKPWKQKGTGRARQGSTRSPQWVGGGRAHAVRPRDYSVEMNMQERRIATRSALRYKLEQGKIHCVDGLELTAPKTRTIAKFLEKVGIMGKGALLISEGAKPMLVKSTNNIPKVNVAERRNLNAGIVLTHANLVFAKPALDALVKELA
ncbi:MAG: 50S ribosomal protein L4 [Planctomycetota bacterium]